MNPLGKIARSTKKEEDGLGAGRLQGEAEVQLETACPHAVLRFLLKAPPGTAAT